LKDLTGFQTLRVAQRNAFQVRVPLEKMKRKTDFIMQNVGGENLLVPLGAKVMDLNGLIILNDTAACVWKLLAHERAVDELTATVAERFDVTPERARVDVQTFVDEIAKMGLIE
jgi:hypothetical protein